MTKGTYEQPREKLARKGVKALSNAELLQIIISSGNKQTSVAKIAKKVAKVLEVNGSNVHPQELLAIQGMGQVKVGQILSLFELATRFPVPVSSDVYDTVESYKPLYADIRKKAYQSISYASFDGAKRLIKLRSVSISKATSLTKQVQKVFADCLTDSAASVCIALGYAKQSLEPSLSELTLVRDVYKTSQLLAIPVNQFVLVSAGGELVLKEVVL